MRKATSLLALLLLASARGAPVDTTWECETLATAALAPAGYPAVTWRQLNCSSSPVPVFGRSGPVVVNVVEADLSDPSRVRMVPVIAPAAAAPGGNPLAPLNKIAEADGRTLIAGINGGYFWRVDVSDFRDGVCMGKSRADADQPASANQPNYGLGDGTIVVDGKLLSSNCDCHGFSRPVSLTINGTHSRFDLQTRGAPPPFGLEYDSLSAGPNLVVTNSSGTFVAIPHDDDNIGNIYEHSANTGVGLLQARNGSSFAYFVTFDGHDGCPLKDPTCGTNAFTLAYFFKDYLHVTSAMNMDQGGSTTMYVKGQGSDGIVTNSGGSPRTLYSGLFLELP